MSDDPILDAKTVAAFFVAVDAAYGLDVPTEFPAGTSLAQMWALPVAVVKDPGTGVLYRATATATYPVAGELAGTVVIDIETAGTRLRRHVTVHVNRKEPSWQRAEPQAPRRHRVPVPSSPPSRRRPRP